jgi:hypothetical protein
MPIKKDSVGLWTKKGCAGTIGLWTWLHLRTSTPCPSLKNCLIALEIQNNFAIVDLRQGFNQIVLTAKDCKKRTFHGSNKLWKWLVMPFGLKNAPVFFQQVMD